MVTYVCLGLLFLFVVSKAIAYTYSSRRAPSEDEVEKTVLTILRKGEGEGE